MTTKTRGAFQLQHVVLLLTVTSLLLTTATAGRCHSDDKAALQAISADLGDYYAAETDIPCCEWFPVDCDPSTGRVVGFAILDDANLTGTIPDAIAGLVHLQELVIHKLPSISGPIPPAIGKLSNLSLLTISWTGVSGPVPSFLSELTQLTFLDLSFNSLTGTIPASLGAIPNLSGINLSRNRLTGGIPALFLSKSADQIYLWLSHNNLSGSIPADFAAANFAHLDLSRNGFAGDASGLFGKGKELRHLDLSRNVFSFNLTGVELPELLDVMDVSHNGIYGGIPAQVANLTRLQLFNVSYNRLCGAVPTGGNLGMFDAYSYQHNKCLCGAPLANPCQ